MNVATEKMPSLLYKQSISQPDMYDESISKVSVHEAKRALANASIYGAVIANDRYLIASKRSHHKAVDLTVTEFNDDRLFMKISTISLIVFSIFFMMTFALEIFAGGGFLKWLVPAALGVAGSLASFRLDRLTKSVAK